MHHNIGLKFSKGADHVDPITDIDKTKTEQRLMRNRRQLSKIAGVG